MKLTINRPYRCKATGRKGRLRRIDADAVLLRTASGGCVRVEMQNLRLDVSPATLANLQTAKPRRPSKYGEQIDQAAAKFGLTAKQYIEAMQCS